MKKENIESKEVEIQKVKSKKKTTKKRNIKLDIESPSSFKKVNKLLTTRVNNLKKKNKEASLMFEGLENGSNSFLRVKRTENTNFDLTWVKIIEDTIPALDEIIKNPRINTKNVSNIVPIELAKKTNSESIRHLSSHSQFVKEIDSEGNVIPNKILNIETEDNYLTYENKFIATLIRRLVLFVEKRYEYIEKYSPLRDYEVLYVKNKSIINGIEYTVESKVISSKISENTSDKEVASTTFMKKIAFIRKYVKYFYSSPFMKMFKNEKNVRSPILQTNIIRKNPRYRKCYELYRFIETYDKLGVSFLIKETFDKPTVELEEKYKNLVLENILALEGSEAKIPFKKREVKKNTRILKSIDDDIFTFYPLGTDPEFIRIDEDYINYKSGKVKDLKKKPKKLERKYDIGKYLSKGKIDKDKARREELLKRKKLEALAFEKEQKELKIKEEKERERLRLLKLKEEEKRRLDELEKARTFVKESATTDLETNTNEENNSENNN